MQSQTIMLGYTTPPSIEDILTIAEERVDLLPEGLTKMISKLRIEVEDFPDDYIIEEMDLETPYDVYGVYQSSGPKALNKTTSSKDDDVLYLYRRPILDYWSETQEDFTVLLNRIIIQEIGYHFHCTEDEIEMFEDETTPEPDVILCG